MLITEIEGKNPPVSDENGNQAKGSHLRLQEESLPCPHPRGVGHRAQDRLIWVDRAELSPQVPKVQAHAAGMRGTCLLE